MQMFDWTSTAGDFTENLPSLAFPLKGELPESYVPQSTILQLSDDSRSHVWLWCYLERKLHGTRYLFNPSSLSSQRVKDLPRAIERLSKRFSFDDSKPRSVRADLSYLSAFLLWLDDPLHERQYESILSDPELGLDALKKYHTHLRLRMQTNATNCLTQAAASNLDVGANKAMSVVHDREYSNEIESIGYRHGEGVKAPEKQDVAAFMACCQGTFDSVVRIVFAAPLDVVANAQLSDLSWQSGGQEASALIPAGTHVERLMELGCMAYAALCVGDSGANLAQIRAYEEPEDMQDQLSHPERLTLRQKVIKLRAGGKEVPVHLTATTVTRLRSYLLLREGLRLRLDCPDIGPMFVQCRYPNAATKARPLGIVPLESTFTDAVRRRFSFFGINLPSVTVQQLRAHKQSDVTRKHNPKVAADTLGTTVSTAIRRYSKITEADSRSEMAPFLASLTSTVLTPNGEGSKSIIPLTPIPPGGCEDHGHPKPLVDNPLVEPDCKKAEGCFFCDKLHVHADQEDAVKLMSCRSVLERLGTRLGDSGAADRVHSLLLNRIGALLAEIKRINSDAHERARVAVLEEGRLSRYWASKLQQLHLLGLLAQETRRA